MTPAADPRYRSVSNKDPLTEALAERSGLGGGVGLESSRVARSTATTSLKTRPSLPDFRSLTRRESLVLSAPPGPPDSTVTSWVPRAGTYPERSATYRDPSILLDAATLAFGNRPRPEVVIGADDRIPVPIVTKNPWNQICALRITTADGLECVGTGWFIGPNTVMTAGHCVYIHDHGGWVKNIRIIPGMNGSDEPYESTSSTELRTTEGWRDQTDTNFDYGAILLPDSRWGTAVGWFGFAALPDEELRRGTANISGYPYDLDRATRQYYHARQITQLSPQRLFYDIDTYGGQSGSPIWFQTDQQTFAIGVHTSGSTSGNSGTRITDGVFQMMKAWKDEAAMLLPVDEGQSRTRLEDKGGNRVDQSAR
jgi:glutamyl endopeptidase